jgi:hypothetical protein
MLAIENIITIRPSLVLNVNTLPVYITEKDIKKIIVPMTQPSIGLIT